MPYHHKIKKLMRLIDKSAEINTKEGRSFKIDLICYFL